MKKSIQAFFTFSAIAVGSLMSSCHIYEDEGDCSVHYRVPFTYTMNILNADAFSSQVSSVTLYVFDSQGHLALTKTESGAALSTPGYAMDVELLPGRYTMLAWCEGTPAYTPSTSFTIGGGGSPSAVTELSATLPLLGDPSALYSDKDITPLFYGYKADIDCPDTYGTVTLPAIDLIKDTNVINIALENLEGTEIAADALSVSIEADNSQMSWTNAVTGDTQFAYRPWSVTLLSSERGDTSRADGDEGTGEGEGEGDNGPAVNPVTGILAELTTGRLMADRKPMLVVHRNVDDKEIIRLDLIKLLCMVRGHFGNWSDQEYLDRLDRYTMTFFVDADLNWYSAQGINILGWKVVPPQDVEF